MTDVLTSWTVNLSGLSAEDKIEAAGDWIAKAMGRSDDAAIRFALSALTGWLDLEMKSHQAQIRALMADCVTYLDCCLD